MKRISNDHPEKDLVLYIMKLLRNQATNLYSGILDLSEQFPGERKFIEFSQEVKSLSLCIRAVGGLALEKIKNTESEGSAFLLASDEIIERITDINEMLNKIKDVIEQENRILN